MEKKKKKNYLDAIPAAASLPGGVLPSAEGSWRRQKPEFHLLFRAEPAKRIIQENKQLHSPYRHFLTSLGQSHGVCVSTGRSTAVCMD